VAAKLREQTEPQHLPFRPARCGWIARLRLLDVVRATDKHLGIQSRLERSSTDANIPFSLGIDAVAIAGGGSGGDAHTPNEWYDPQGRDLGLKRILLATLVMSGISVSPTGTGTV